MASIIENLITELNDEYALYEQLLQVSMEKTGAIVSNNLDRLSETTEKEQRLADALASVEHRRRETMTNVANILGKRPDDVKVMDVVTFLEGQPEFHDPLLAINEKLAKLARKVREVNGHNQNLIRTYFVLNRFLCIRSENDDILSHELFFYIRITDFLLYLS